MEITHPILKEYLSTNDSIDSIVQKHYNKTQFLEIVFKDLTINCHKEVNTEFLQVIDKAILKGNPEPNIYLLFISIAMTYCRLCNHIEKANSLASIGTSIISNKIHPMVKASFIQAIAKVKHYEGKIDESLKLISDALNYINETDPRYMTFLSNVFLLLAGQGQLNSQKILAQQLQNSKYLDDNLFYLELIIINDINTAESQNGLHVYDLYINQKKENLTYRFEIYFQLLKLVSGDFNKANFQSIILKKMADIYLFLSIGKIEEASKAFLEIDIDSAPHIMIKYFLDNLSLQLELNKWQKGKAALLLKEKKKKGNVHYLDDLFYGRIHLLSGDLASVNNSFSRLTKNINRYGARKRLLFELQFAKEMPLHYILQLINGWNTIDNNIIGQSKTVMLNSKVKVPKGLKLLIGKSSLILETKELVKKYSKLKAPILITGETGTGKELVSRAIHDEGQNSDEPFLAINCGALTDALLQSELFGYEAGAFTGAQKQRIGIFEAAGKGTVFLDEFGDISPKLQVSLLRVLEANEIRLIGSNETRKIECKIVVATNVDLHSAVLAKKFREDLFYRLARFEIQLPALRERIEDLSELINYFLEMSSQDSGKTKYISNDLVKALETYRWPGNIRELKNEVERLYILNPDQEILGLEEFDFSHLQEPLSFVSNSPITTPPITINSSNVKNEFVQQVIQKGFPIKKRHNLMIDLFKEYKKLTKSQIVEITKIGDRTATKDLQMLIKKGNIIRRSPTKSTRTDYFEFIEE